MEGPFNIDKPRWDQSTFIGRLYHFANVTDPRLVLRSTKDFIAAKNLVELYRQQKEPLGTTMPQLYDAQKLYQSAFHPDTGDLQNVVGRMSFYFPGGTILCAAMVTFYRSTGSVVFWQWSNQSFNALVNYTNRNAKSTMTTTQLGIAYVSATSAALATALGLKYYLAQRGGSLIQRLVPLAAVFAANCVNIPLMRQNEIIDGMTLVDEHGIERGQSRLAALKAICLVVISRNFLVTPVMLFTPIIMERVDKLKFFQRYHRLLNTPLQTALTAAMLLFMVPIGCALFPQNNSIQLSSLEKYDKKSYYQITHINWTNKKDHYPKQLYFNKGL